MSNSNKNSGNVVVSLLNALVPDNEGLAISTRKESLSYQALLVRVANLINFIHSQIPSGNKPIAMVSEKRVEPYIILLSIMGSGNTYLPITNKIPAERAARMLDSSDCNHIIYTPGMEKYINQVKAASQSGGLITDYRYDESFDANETEMSSEMIADVLAKSDTIKSQYAYIMFTSGSTGLPKGIAVSHENLESYLNNVLSMFAISAADKFSQLYEFNFDPSILDIFLCFSNKACLCVPDATDLLLPNDYVKRNEITFWSSVPSIIKLMDNCGRLQEKQFPSIRHSIFSGEALLKKMADKWMKSANNTKIYNFYGPTETTITIANHFYDSEADTSDDGSVPIGKVHSDHEYRILDEDGKQSAQGELYVAGKQVSDGYINNPEQTQSSFVQLGDKELRWYKTGDLVTENEKSELSYLGRVDDQVKINGQRIELNEINSVIKEIAKTDDVYSVVKESGNSNLYIYSFVLTKETFEKAGILQHCKNCLPSYMVPKDILAISSIPLNVNGKLDKKKLLELVA